MSRSAPPEVKTSGATPAASAGLTGPSRRILVIAGYYPPHIGGVEVCAQRYGEGMAQLGRSVEVITSAAGAAPRSRRTSAAGVAVTRLRGWHPLHTPVLPGLPLAAWRGARGALVHLHLGHMTTDVVGALAARLRRSPLVAHYHMDVPAAGRLGAVVLPIYKRLVLGPLLRSAALVVVLTDGHRDDVVSRHRLDPDRVVTIPNGVDRVYLDLDRGGSAHDEPLRVLSVGRLVPQKDPLALLRALSAMSAPVEALVVGDGELAEPLRSLRDDLGLTAVELPGVLVGPALLDAYRRSDVFVLTSAVEGMPLALLQAMAAGLAVVVRDTPELRELVADAGEVVSDPSPTALAAVLDELARDPARRARLGRAARLAATPATWAARVAALDAALAPLEPDSTTGGPRARRARL